MFQLILNFYRWIYKKYGWCARGIILLDYSENGQYIVSEPYCCICGKHTKSFNKH